MENHTREQLLKLLENNSRLTNAELAIMLDVTQEQIHDEIASLEKRAYYLWLSYTDQLG